MAPIPKIYDYEAIYSQFLETPTVELKVWDQPATEEDRAYFVLAPEAEVVIYNHKIISRIPSGTKGFNGLWLTGRWGDIQKLLREDLSVIPLAELEKKKFRVGVAREVWEVPYPHILGQILESIRAKNHRRNLQIEKLKETLGIAR